MSGSWFAHSVRRIGGATKRSWEWIEDFSQMMAAVYAIIGVPAAAAYFLGQDPTMAPVWPLNYYSLVWGLAAIFPLAAALYLGVNLRTRIHEIQEAAEMYNYPTIYFPGVNRAEARVRFARYLRQRYREYYNAFELAAWAVITGAIVLIGGIFLAAQMELPTTPGQITAVIARTSLPPWKQFIGASFLGGVSGALVVLYRKYRSFDLYPSTYLQLSMGMLVAFASGSLIGTLPYVTTPFVALAFSFLTVVNVNFYARFLRTTFAKLTQTDLPKEIPNDLDAVIQNSAAVESLMSVSINSVAEFARTDPIRLYLNLSQPIGVINGWIDEALLHYYFGTIRKDLDAAYVRRFTQILEQVVDVGSASEIAWLKEPPITKTEKDGGVAAAVRAIIATGSHHRALSILSPSYRLMMPVPPRFGS
jgi:hypothetical protein